MFQPRAVAILGVMPPLFTYTRKPVAVIEYSADPPVAIQWPPYGAELSGETEKVRQGEGHTAQRGSQAFSGGAPCVLATLCVVAEECDHRITACFRRASFRRLRACNIASPF